MTQIPAFEVSELTQRRIMKAAVAGRADNRPPMLLLAAALLLALTLAMVAGVGALLNRQQQTPDLGVDRAVELAGRVHRTIRRAVDARACRLRVAGRGRLCRAIPGTSIVKVVSDNLRVRSAPRVADDSIKLEPLLKVGDRLFVVGGPVVANDYEWYEVAPVNIDGERTWFTLPSGWIARGDHDGTPWVAVDAPRCPAEPVDVEALAAMHALERLACFGSRPLAFRAVIDGGGPPVACDAGAGQGPCVAGPDWLAGSGGWTADTASTATPGARRRVRLLTLDPPGPVQASALPKVAS